nr:MAG TPA: hypothetical protein [Caudoviricetes sp.]
MVGRLFFQIGLGSMLKFWSRRAWAFLYLFIIF